MPYPLGRGASKKGIKGGSPPSNDQPKSKRSMPVQMRLILLLMLMLMLMLLLLLLLLLLLEHRTKCSAIL